MTPSACVRRALAAFVLLAALPAGAQVIQFSPQGTVKQVRQVTARFAEAMVPFGDPRAVVQPFTADCPEKGSGKWIDSRTWVYDFERDLPAGIRCSFRLRTELRALSGKPVGGRASFELSTGGPAIQWSVPNEGNERVDERQAFALILDAEAKPASIVRHVKLSIEGLPELVGVRVLEGEERKAVLDALPPWAGVEDRPVAVVQARQRFPNGARVRLIWGKDVESASGVRNRVDQTLRFVTRPEFSAYIHCQRTKPEADCVPLGKIGLYFTAPVAWDLVKQITLTGPNGKARHPDEPESPADFVQSAEFAGPFPQSTEYRVEIPSDLRDDTGRDLVDRGDFPLAVKTDAFPPLAKFAARFGILESKADPALPVTLRNVEATLAAGRTRVTREIPPDQRGGVQKLLDRVRGTRLALPPQNPEQILPWLRRLAMTKRDVPLLEGDSALGAPVERFDLPKPDGPQELEVVGIPFASPGLYVVELTSPRLGEVLLDKAAPMYVRAAALVTNLSVHFKWGRESSLAWVTTLDDARPVGGARVTVHDCHGKEIASAETDGDGIARISALPDQSALPGCYDSGAFDSWEAPDYQEYYGERALRSLDSGLLVVARTPDDLSFVHSSWMNGIEPWRFELPEQNWQDPIVAHTILDRPLFRAGETVHMKHILRAETLSGFGVLRAEERPTLATVRHLGSNETHDLPIQWDENGLAEGDWQIPRGAKLGRYSIVLRRLAKTSDGPTPGPTPTIRAAEWQSGAFRVEEFRVPLMKAALKLPAEAQVDTNEVPVDLSVQYLAGGGAGGLPTVLRSQVEPYGFTAKDDLEKFTFANGPVREGLVRSNEEDEENEPGEEEPAATRPLQLAQSDLVLDASGAARATIGKIPDLQGVRQLRAEAEFRDPNGEVQTVSSTVPLWPAALLAGVKAEHWAGTKDALHARAAVVDTAAKPVAGAEVRIDVFERVTYSNRKRLVGGFYGYEHVRDTKAAGTLCTGKTDQRGILRCEATPPRDGNLILQATVTDATGRASTAHQDLWVSGDDEWGFTVDATDRMDLLPEKHRYEPGEKARFQVRMPFRKATALVTTEREGILDATVRTLSGNDPVVELPVRGEHAPNVFVSVLAVRGRVDAPAPTSMIDLARPSFKLGIAEIQVGWQAHELAVKVDADRPVYQVRDKAKVKFAVRTPDGDPPPAGSEIAVAAVDEGLLELEPNRSWSVLDALMRRRGYRVQTSTAQMQVVGKRHYGRKALPPGGGGGKQSTRELFDTLLLWRARLPLDANGNAEIEVPLNDSLTAFRIVAVATAGVDRFGTGATTIRSTQDLMLLSGLAPLVREGDREQVEFTLRNTTERPMQVALRAAIEEAPGALGERRIDLAPGEARVVTWDVEVPKSVERLHYTLEANAGTATDRLRVEQQVRPAVPVRTFQSTLLRWEKPIRQPVAAPRDALPGRGGIDVRADPTLAASLDGVRAWMRDYPYTCLEQKVSRAVALGDEDQPRGVSVSQPRGVSVSQPRGVSVRQPRGVSVDLRSRVLADLPTHLDADGLLKYFPTMRDGSEVLTAYVVSLTRAAGWELPADVETRVAEGLKSFIEGRLTRRSELETADLSIRKLAAIDALARIGRAEPGLLGSITIEPNLWPTSAVLDWWSILRRVPGVKDAGSRMAEAEHIVRARLDLRGTTIRFSSESSDGLWWLMVSSETNALRLLLHLIETDRWREDLPRLVRGAVALQSRGAWQTTVANAWGTIALRRFVERFEAESVSGTTTGTLGDGTASIDWSERGEHAMSFPWPSERADLVVDHSGGGNPWITISSRAAIPLTEPLSSGLTVTRTVTPIEPREGGALQRGDRLRVHLEVDAASDMTWVVVSDPIPAGSSHLGTGLARDSRIGATAEPDPEGHVGRSRREAVAPSFVERSFEALRAYYEFVPKGRFSLDYVIRLNQSGHFQLPTTRTEALYAPETFGEAPNAPVEVGP